MVWRLGAAVMTATADHDSLARGLQALEDKEALRTLMIRGWRALDRKDWQTSLSPGPITRPCRPAQRTLARSPVSAASRVSPQVAEVSVAQQT